MDHALVECELRSPYDCEGVSAKSSAGRYRWFEGSNEYGFNLQPQLVFDFCAFSSSNVGASLRCVGISSMLGPSSVAARSLLAIISEHYQSLYRR